MAKFDAIAAMQDDGARPSRSGDWEDDRFYYRMCGTDMQVAMRAHFDRWANSVDFVFALPKTEKAYRKLRSKLDEAVLTKRYDPGLGKELRL